MTRKSATRYGGIPAGGKGARRGPGGGAGPEKTPLPYSNMEVINTESKKDEFLKAWTERYPNFKSPQKFHEQKDHKNFADALNKAPEIRKLFNKAVAEATEEPEPAAGLSELFGWDEKAV